MEIGVFYFPVDYGINIAELAAALEERGFESLFVPEHPETKARVADAEAAEAKVDMAALVAQCVERTETIHCVE